MKTQKGWNLPVLVAVVGLILLCSQGAQAWSAPDNTPIFQVLNKQIFCTNLMPVYE